MTTSIVPALVAGNVAAIIAVLFSRELTVKMGLAIYGGLMLGIVFIWVLPAFLPAEPQQPTFSLTAPLVLAGLNLAGAGGLHYLERRRAE